MSNKPKQPGDAVLRRDGSVELAGRLVGLWWQDDYHWYHFASAEKQAPLISTLFRHELKSAIPEIVGRGS